MKVLLTRGFGSVSPVAGMDTLPKPYTLGGLHAVLLALNAPA